MKRLTFDAFFEAATADTAQESGLEPFDYQCRLACGEQAGRDRAEWLSYGTDCRSLLVNVPTGCGKTAAVVLAWLWNRVALRREDWPRRLAYCLPMRVLVEQNRDNVRRWLSALVRAGLGLRPSGGADLTWLAQNSPIVLMGGEDEGDWDLHPERETIVIGTQDMLLSRALNRGYAAGRSRWPMHFGLLNTDCLWVFDEVQLMGPGLATTAQLQAFRRLLGSSDSHRCCSIWMSATLQRDWLKTVDFHDRVDGLSSQELTEKDFKHKELEKWWNAKKPVTRAKALIGDVRSLASEIRSAHNPGTRTIAVVNTIRRACQLFEALQGSAAAVKTRGKRRKEAVTLEAGTDRPPELVLLHSRFRPGDRRKAVERALADSSADGTIVVSTQVIEAGVDVSAAALFTELAPWASLVQRFGRCNRRGEVNDRAAVRWIDLPESSQEAAKLAAPYDLDDLGQSAKRLHKLGDVGLESLQDVPLPFEHTHVIRRKDLLDLFDTTPDLAGNEINIDRFVRDVENSDVRVFWRDWSQPNGHDAPPEDEPAPRGQELCPAPLGEFRRFVQDENRKGKVWRWNFLDGTWERVNRNADTVAPGQLFLLHVQAGGYTTERGWDPDGAERVDPVIGERTGRTADGTDADGVSQIGVWQAIAEHTSEVCRELETILDGIAVDGAHVSALRLAARWHDRGKAHEVFQNAIDDGQEVRRTDKTVRRRERPQGWRSCRFIAKAPDRRKDRMGTVVDLGFWRRYERKHFRHELASALVVLDPHNGQIPDDVRDLIAYVVAAHHGKVRLSLRSLPDEHKPRDAEGHHQPGKRFARGVWDGDGLPDTDLGGGVRAPAITLSLEPMELGLREHEPFTGQPSWGERMIRLRDSLGPFRLGYLETLLRAADMRASRAAEQRAAESAGWKEARSV